MKVPTLLAGLTLVGCLLWACETPETPTFSVGYHANGATGGTAPNDGAKYKAGATVSVLGNTGSLVKTNYNFVGWNTKANGTGIGYVAGTTLAMPGVDLTLYADWSKTASGTGTPVAPSTYSVTVAGPTFLAYGTPADFNSTFDGLTSTYQWYLNGTALVAQTSTSLSVTPTAGVWYFGSNLITLVVTDTNGVAYSGGLIVTVGN